MVLKAKTNLSRGSSSLFFITTNALSTWPYQQSPNTSQNAIQKAKSTHQREFLSDGFYGPGDVLVQGRMTRLKHGCIELLPPNE